MLWCSAWWQIVADVDLEALLSDELFQPEAIWRLTDLQVRPSTHHAGSQSKQYRFNSSVQTVQLHPAQGKL